MPNLVEPLRSAVLARYPDAVIVGRGPRHILHRRPSGLYVLDTSLATLHYGQSEIDTDLVPSDDGNFTDMCRTAPFLFYGDGNGRRRLYPRRDVLDEYVEFARPQYWTGSAWANLVMGTRTRTGNRLSWERPAFRLEVQHAGSGVKVTVVLKTSAAAKRIRWPVTLTGLTFQNWQLWSGGTPVLDLHKPTLVDANGTSGSITADYVNGAIEFNADIAGLVYPITIDPTIETYVGAGADDAHQENVSYSAFLTQTPLYLRGLPGGGYNKYVAWRWQISGPVSGDTVTAAYINCYINGTIDGNFDFEAADNAAAFQATTNNISARTLTGNPVYWQEAVSDTLVDSPSLVGPVQSVINRAGWNSGNSMLCVAVGASQSNGCTIRAYEGWPSWSAQLHIEYTTGGGSGPTLGARRTLLGVGI